MFKKTYLLLLVLAINVQTQNPEEESGSTDSQPSQQVVDSSNKETNPDNSSESYYKAKLKELENNESDRKANEFREVSGNISLEQYATETALNVYNSAVRLYNYLNPSESQKAENEKGKNLKMEYKAIRLLSVCMRAHVKGELDEKFHMPKACEKEVKEMLSLNPQIFAEKQHAFNYMRR